MYSPFLIASFLSVSMLIFSVTLTNAEGIDQDRYGTPYATIYYYQEDTTIPSVLENYKVNNFNLSKETIDRMVYRVKTILGMYPQDLNFGIQMYHTHDELTKLFRSIGLGGDVPVAFYSLKDKTIYLSSENLSDRIIVHEIAHAVMNAYFVPVPPRHVQEILAQYVERHYLY